jgi:hypothetical protein
VLLKSLQYFYLFYDTDTPYFSKKQVFTKKNRHIELNQRGGLLFYEVKK